jgi:hypothetical protein
LNANLVCYKGHNFPVWDAQVMHYSLKYLIFHIKHAIYFAKFGGILDILNSPLACTLAMKHNADTLRLFKSAPHDYLILSA